VQCMLGFQCDSFGCEVKDQVNVLLLSTLDAAAAKTIAGRGHKAHVTTQIKRKNLKLLDVIDNCRLK
jgi:hypothetical protein